MANHWAIAIGISQYTYMDSLKYANRDVTALQDYLTQANFSSVYSFSDQSTDIALDREVTLPTQPTLANLQRFLKLRFATPFLQPEDTLWFFYIGHGWHYGNQDYLMPADGHPDFADSTALSVESVANYLKRSGTQKIVMVLDACHTETQKFGQGFGTDPKGVITLFSAGFNQTSRKLEPLQQGSFTCALVDALQSLSQNQRATISHLHRLLNDTLPNLNRRFLKPPQQPRLQIDPSLSAEMISIPQAIVQTQNWVQRLWLSYKLNYVGKPAIPKLIDQGDRHSDPSRAIAGLTGSAICVSLLGYMGLQHSNWIPFRLSPAPVPIENPSTRPPKPTKIGTQANRVAPTRLVPNQPDHEAGLGEVPSERIPRPGVYYPTNPQFTAFRREIGKSGNRLCIKLVNGSPNTPKGQPKVVVSSVSRRPGGFYIDATDQKLSLGSFYSELSDGKLLWQRLETYVDESGLMGECLTAKAGYVRSYQVN